MKEKIRRAEQQKNNNKEKEKTQGEWEREERRRKMDDSFPLFSHSWKAAAIFILRNVGPVHWSALITERSHLVVFITSQVI